MVRLPRGYQEVEWIRGTGTQYILTGFYPKSTSKVTVKMAFPENAVYNNGVGAISSKNTRFAIGHVYSEETYFTFNFSNKQRISSGVILDSLPHVFTIDAVNKRFSVDDQSVVDASANDLQSQSVVSFPLCAFYGVNSSNYDPIDITIYRCSCFTNNALVNDFIPCYRTSDDEIGMYDLVGNTFYTNSGTGTFLKGPEVHTGINVPYPYQPVSYIQAPVGGQNYFKTGVVPSSDVVIEYTYSLTRSGSGCILGSADGSSDRNALAVSVSSSESGYVQFGNNNETTTIPMDALYTTYNCVLEQGTYTKNDTAYTIYSTLTGTSVQDIWLFCRNVGNTPYNALYGGRLHACKIYKNGMLVRDFIPCYRKYDTEVGLYDQITGTFYINQGSESFTKGPDIESCDILTIHNQLLAAQPHLESVTGANGLAAFEGDFPAKVKKVTIPFSPVQDLNGYDNPWPAGGNKNLIPDGTDTSNGYVATANLNPDGSTSSNADCYVSEYFPMTAGSTYTWSGPSIMNASCICFYDSNKTFISSIQAERLLPKTFTAPADTVYCRATQYIVFVSDGNSCQIEAGSTATTRLPYSNVCPISGWTGVTVYDVETETIQITVKQSGSGTPSPTNVRPITGISLTRDDDTVITIYAGDITINQDGTSTVVSTLGKKTFTGDTSSETYAKTLGEAFWTKGGATAYDEYYGGIDNNVAKQYSTSQNIGGNYCSHGLDSTVSSDTGALRFHTWYATNNPPTGKYQPRIIFPKSMGINTTAKANAWIANQYANGTPVEYTFWLKTPITYNLSVSETKRLLANLADAEHTIPISWQSTAGTVYGGSITLNEDGSADLANTCEIYTVNGSEVYKASNVYTNVAYAEWYKPLNCKLRTISNNATAICVCDIGAVHRTAGGFDNASRINQLAVSAYGTSWWYGFPVGTDLATMQSTLDGAHICYELYPQYQTTYHFDNVGQLQSFLGTNSIWTDLNGNPTVEFWKHD